MDNLTFITGNKHKAEQVAKYLSSPIKHQSLHLDELQSLNLEEIIEHKANGAYAKIKSPVLVEDISMTIHTLGKLPGPFIKFFMEELGPQGICDLVKRLPNNKATVEAVVGFFDGKKLVTFKSKVQGRIAEKVSGERGFGFDVYFIPDGFDQTRAEMDEKNYNKTNHRKKVWKKVERYLKQNG